jgi:hypothetical protein
VLLPRNGTFKSKGKNVCKFEILKKVEAGLICATVWRPDRVGGGTRLAITTYSCVSSNRTPLLRNYYFTIGESV